MKTTHALVLSLVFAGCARDPAKDAPKADVAAATPAATAAEAPAGSLAIDTGKSELKWTGSKVTKTHPGGFKSFRGYILPGETMEAGKVTIEIDVDSIYTDTEKLVGHLKSPDFFDVAKFPKATFTSTEIKPEEGKDGTTHLVKGNLTMHGVTKEITFPATIKEDATQITANAKFSLNRKDFGIVYPGAPDDLIRDDVLVEWHIVAPKPADKKGA